MATLAQKQNAPKGLLLPAGTVQSQGTEGVWRAAADSITKSRPTAQAGRQCHQGQQAGDRGCSPGAAPGSNRWISPSSPVRSPPCSPPACPGAELPDHRPRPRKNGGARTNRPDRRRCGDRHPAVGGAAAIPVTLMISTAIWSRAGAVRRSGDHLRPDCHLPRKTELKPSNPRSRRPCSIRPWSFWWPSSSPILLLFVIPQFEDIFRASVPSCPPLPGSSSPSPRFMQGWWYAIFGGAALAVFLYVRAWRKSQKVRDNTGQVHPHHSRGGQHTAQGSHGPFCLHPPPPSPPVSRTGGCPGLGGPEHRATMSIAQRPWPFATRWWPGMQNQRRHAHRGSFPRHGDPDGDDR